MNFSQLKKKTINQIYIWLLSTSCLRTTPSLLRKRHFHIIVFIIIFLSIRLQAANCFLQSLMKNGFSTCITMSMYVYMMHVCWTKVLPRVALGKLCCGSADDLTTVVYLFIYFSFFLSIFLPPFSKLLKIKQYLAHPLVSNYLALTRLAHGLWATSCYFNLVAGTQFTCYIRNHETHIRIFEIKYLLPFILWGFYMT